MAKRKSIASPALPRKRTKLDQPTETPSLQSLDTDATASSSSSPSPSPPPRPLKRKRPVDNSIDSQDESDTSTSTKRAKTESPREPSPDFDYGEILLHDDYPEAQAHIYWEPTDLTEEARRWREIATLYSQGYVGGCSCGKMHMAIGRKSWHYPGQEPELDDEPGQPFPEQDEAYAQSASTSAYRSRGRQPLLSPELSDDEIDAGNNQSSSAPIDVSTPREPSNTPDLPEPVVPEIPDVSPNPSLTIAPTVNVGRVSRQRNVKKSTPRHKTPRKNKDKTSKGKKDKTVEQQPRNRKREATNAAKESAALRRSSRRNAQAQLWFLDDRGKACEAAVSLT
ncbi:hypothetical protein TGAM01_v205004 [Trichoderma gamsii]|uniref:Uncharacterized protein n=1 Tax=Trichoderma gamsii TaxID=398673 RepID=A0A2P4ZP37_9HYPO|nr:hypothetical protein TGAM01_v205004 [Trichoderma gamsii]PON26060.1 hypothetical protein TGAM01_v205004 [Trichoderma gamsii]